MRLIAGLGNPGPEFALTPHNLGFAVIERLVAQARIRNQKHRHRARVWQGRLDQEEVLLVQPQTYMNLSGEAIGALLAAEGLTPADLIVIADDVALPWGSLRIRERGSSGGHNGLESVLTAVGTTEFVRVRLGIGPRDGGVEALEEYVLGPMSAEEKEIAEEMVERAAQAIRVVLREGAGRAMARFNRRWEGGEAEVPGENSTR